MRTTPAPPLDAPEPGLATAVEPRIARFVSAAPGTAGLACHGVVLEDDRGIPTRIGNLSRMNHGHDGRSSPRGSGLSQLRAALDLFGGSGPPPEDAPGLRVETVAPEERAARILPPVAADQARLDGEELFILGAGMNYAAHRAEVGLAPTRPLLFPKPVAPTGAYAPLVPGVAGDGGGLATLLDYEAEIGFVLLADVDLGEPLPDLERFFRLTAFFLANDVSDRAPIILDPVRGYTAGKARPGYLPLGPWLVPGGRLAIRAGGEGTSDLALALRIRSAGGPPDRWALRQASRSTEMIVGPRAILAALAARHRRGDRGGMRDAHGQPRYLFRADGVLPAGSIVLTGTPGGTAIRDPGWARKLKLLIAGGFSVAGAKRRLLAEQQEQRGRLGYLAPGDLVETTADRLGRQLWPVEPGTVRGSCPPEAAGFARSGAEPA